MRVLHLIPSISPLRGGPSQAVLSMVAALRQQGVDASILTTNDDGSGIQSAMPLGRWHDYKVLGEHVPVLAFGRLNRVPKVFREFSIAPGLSKWLGKHVRDYSLVHVHALFSYPTSVGMAQIRRQRVPYIVRTIGQLNAWSLRQSVVRKRFLLNVLDRRNLQQAAAIHYTSVAEQMEAQALALDTSSYVLPLGVSTFPDSQESMINTCHNSQSPYSSTVRFLFLSRIHPKKQLPVLFQALSLLNKANNRFRWNLDLAGDGEPDYIQSLHWRAKELGIADQITWHGFVAGQAKQRLLQHADWFVLPSASENFGIAAAEALMAGTPVILAPGVALAQDVIHAGAGKVCDSEPMSLYRCLETCLDPPTLTMKSAAKRLAVDNFGWPSLTNQLIQHYAHIVNGSK